MMKTFYIVLAIVPIDLLTAAPSFNLPTMAKSAEELAFLVFGVPILILNLSWDKYSLITTLLI
jgi:hypothetical protein